MTESTKSFFWRCNVKRITSLLLVVLLAFAGVTVLYAAGDQEATGDDPVSVMVYERGWVPSDRGTMEDNDWVDWIREDSGLNIQIVPVPRGEVRPVLNTRFAAGNAPDVINDFSRDTIALLHAQGVLAPLDQWIDQYSTSVKQYLEDNPELDPYLRFGDDNELYAVTSRRSPDSISGHLMWIRKDWLDALGLEIPRTEEEFFAVADAFVNEDPNGTGEDDTFAFAADRAYVKIIEALYGVYSRNWYVDDTGVIAEARTQERLVDFFNFHQLAHERGWVDPEVITDTQRQRQRQLWVTGRAGIHFSGDNPPEYAELIANVPEAEIVPLGSFETDHGNFGLLQEPPAERFVALNREITNPEGAIKYLDWLIDDGWFTLRFGIEGQHHEMVNGVPKTLLSGEEHTEQLRYAWDYILLQQWQLKTEWLPILAAEDPVSQEIARLTGEAIETQLSTEFRRDTPFRPTQPEVLNFNTEFSAVFGDILVEVQLGRISPQEAYDRSVAEWDRLGGEEVQQIVQAWYDANSANWRR
jgi:putative aldouronate transport system substrate-binding protein